MSSDASIASAPAESFGAELRCPQCDYDLRALVSDRCPECGMTIDRAALWRSQVPWTYRSEMGRANAYARTAWLVFWRPRRIAAEAARPVNFGDARAFRRVTVWLAFVPLFAWIVWGFVTLRPAPTPSWRIPMPTSAFDLALQRPDVPPPHAGFGLAAQAIVAVAMSAGLWLFLYMATAVGSYFFHPASVSVTRQNRAVALSYYACASLSATPLTVLLGTMAIVIEAHRSSSNILAFQIFALLVCATFALLGVQLVSWVRCSLTVLHYATNGSVLRGLGFVLFLPFAWIILAMLIFVGIALFALLVVVVVLSLL